MPIPVDFRMSRLFRFIPFIRSAGSREVTWTTSDLISRDWRRIQFWKCSIFAFLRKIVKDEIEKLQNWIKFITKRFDPFWNIQKHPKWIFSAHSRQFGYVQKILEILKIWKLENSFKMIQWGWRIQVYFSWLSILEKASYHLSLKYKKYLTEVGFEPTPPKRLEP